MIYVLLVSKIVNEFCISSRVLIRIILELTHSIVKTKLNFHVKSF